MYFCTLVCEIVLLVLLFAHNISLFLNSDNVIIIVETTLNNDSLSNYFCENYVLSYFHGNYIVMINQKHGLFV